MTSISILQTRVLFALEVSLPFRAAARQSSQFGQSPVEVRFFLDRHFRTVRFGFRAVLDLDSPDG